MSDIAIARNRFGLGARAGEAAPDSAKGWLLDQLGRFESRPSAIANAPGRAEAAAQIVEYLEAGRENRQLRRAAQAEPQQPKNDMESAAMQARRAERRDLRDIYAQSVSA